MGKPIKTYSIEEIERLVAELEQPSFRANQLLQWLYVHKVDSYESMTNLPSSLRTSLTQNYPLRRSSITSTQISKDGTRKYLITFDGDDSVETVAIPSRDASHLTVCFSTQVGCGMSCVFCATGQEGFTRNLFPGEMVDQILLAQEDMKTRVSNVVAMGQGEPFLNYDNVIATLKILNNKKLLDIGARHITVSTCGVIPNIERFSNEPEQFTLAVSLHAARQELRNKLMPRVNNMPLTQLKDSLLQYVLKTNRRVSLEYIMLKDINDTQKDLDALIAFCDSLHCHVNLIPLNRVPNSPLAPSASATIAKWKETLTNHGSETTVRESRGSDIQGACGQLKNSR